MNKDTGWFCSDDPFGGGVYKTTNGSLTWQNQLGASFQPKRLFMLNKDTGWVAGQGNGLYRTTNSGINWNLQFTFTAGTADLFFVSKDTAWALAGPTGIMKSVNGGNNWFSQTNPGTVTNGSRMFFLNNQKGWVGVFSNRMLATTNGGLDWGVQTTPANVNYSVFFTDSLHGWAGTNILISTTDGGGPFVGVQQLSTEVPSEYILFQNYPNPFNPTTNIKYQITKNNSEVKISVYDAAGKHITDLVDQRHSAGIYLTDWNASGFSSGVYFYSLSIDDEVIDSKKMALLK